MALIHLALALFLYLTLALQQDFAAALLASLFAAAATWPLLYLFADNGDRSDHSVALIYLALGLSLSGLFALIGASLGMSRPYAIEAFGVALYGASVARWLLMRGLSSTARPPSQHRRPPRRAVLATLILCVVGAAPTLFYATLMGRGDYPAVFFNADNPYHLSHVWSMLRDDSYPVMSLAVFGERRVYQYGGQATAALLSAVSGLQPHTTYLGVVYPLYKVGAIAAGWRLGRSLCPGLPLWITAGTLAAFSRFPLYVRETAAAWDLTLGGWPTPPPINLFGIDHVLTHFGMFSALLVAAYIAEERPRTLRFPALASLAMLPVFKMSFFLGLGAAFGAWSVVRAVQSRSLRPLFPGILTLAAATIIIRVLGLASLDTAGGLVVSPFAHLRDLLSPIGRKIAGAFGESTVSLTVRGLRQIAGEYAIGFHWLIAGVAAVLLACWRNVPRRWPEWLALSLAPLAFLNIFKYVRGPVDNESIRSSINTTFTLVPYLVLAGSLALTASAASARLNATRRQTLYALFAVYIGYFAATNLSAAITLVSRPAAGYEYADNRSIAEALRTIPAERSLVVTNDTRYPATNFAASDLQMQIPGIFGHRAYFVDGVNDRFDGSSARSEKQRLLRARTWDPGLTAIAKAEGWTHLLVRRDYPHPDSIPLKRTFENSDYAVYEF